jgi:hypothetical protein
MNVIFLSTLGGNEKHDAPTLAKSIRFQVIE